MLSIWLFCSVSFRYCPSSALLELLTSFPFRLDTDNCESCTEILEELETIDDDTDKFGIQFVKANDMKLAHEIGIFAFPTLVYYETGVPIMYDGEYDWLMISLQLLNLNVYFSVHR